MLTNIPGVFSIGEMALAEQLEWSVEGLREGYRELFREGLAKADWKARLVWVPGAIRHNLPENPNVVLSWANTWDELPECDLKSEAFEGIKDALYARAEALGKAFEKGCRKGIGKGSPKGMANQDQDQDQDQEQDQIPQSPQREGASLGPVSGSEASAQPRGVRAGDAIPVNDVATLEPSHLPGLLEIAGRGYAAGIRSVTRHQFAFDHRPEEVRAISSLCVMEAMGKKGEALETAMTVLAADYCRANREHAQFEGGFKPSKCVEWINGGKKKREPPSGRFPRAAQVPVQSAEGRCWKMPDEAEEA